MQSVPNRWMLAAAAVAMQMCLGIIYAWAVFRGPLEKAYGWDKTMSIAPYRWSILFFTLAMIVAGFWVMPVMRWPMRTDAGNSVPWSFSSVGL